MPIAPHRTTRHAARAPHRAPRGARGATPSRGAVTWLTSHGALVLTGVLTGVLVAAPAAAQFPRAPSRAAHEPAVWVSASGGLFQAESVNDGRTGSVWDPSGNAAQWRGSVEAALSRGLSVGVTGAFASLPARYVVTGAAATPPISGAAPCLAAGACGASIDVVTALVTGRLGGGRGFHQVVELSLGVNQFRNFRADDGSRLAPERDTDLTGSIGYGFGYGFTGDIQLALVQDFAFNRHQRDALPRGSGSLTQQRATRLALRLGFAERRVR
jgi:hypothetical protein